MTNLFIYGSCMKGQVNHKYFKTYSPIKATLRGYRRCWPRSKDTAILIRSPLGSVNGDLFLDISEKDLNRIIRLHGIPHNYTSKNVIVTTLKEKKQWEAMIFYPNDEIIQLWLRAEKKANESKKLLTLQPSDVNRAT